jgi:DNA-binding NarL/FixJ family response regulator
MPAKVFIVDDHPIFRHGLQQVIDRDPNFTVVGEAGDGAVALAEMKRLRPDIAILDIRVPGLGGIELGRELRLLSPPVAIIFLTMTDDEGTFNAAMDLGAQGFIVKENAVQDVMVGLNAVVRGGIYFSPSISVHLLRRNQRASALREKKTGLKSLTSTERCVLRLVAENKTNREIAKELFVSPRTVEVHRAHICEKLELQGNRALLLFAVEHKSELPG